MKIQVSLCVIITLLRNTSVTVHLYTLMHTYIVTIIKGVARGGSDGLDEPLLVRSRIFKLKITLNLTALSSLVATYTLAWLCTALEGPNALFLIGSSCNKLEWSCYICVSG